MTDRRRVIISTCSLSAALLAPIACRVPPTRPDQLDPGRFFVAVKGHMGAPDTSARLDEEISGAACRVGTYVLLDNRRQSRRLVVWVPAFPPTSTTYSLRARELPPFRPNGPTFHREPSLPPVPGTAEGHLNYAHSSRRRLPTSSMQMVDGTVTVSLSAAGDLQGVIRAKLRQDADMNSRWSATAELTGMFRVDALEECAYFHDASARRASRQ